MRSHRLIPLALALVAGCSREYTFRNLTGDSVIVSVALQDSEGNTEEVVGAVVDPGQEVEVNIHGGGMATASVWKGVLQQGRPVRRVDLDLDACTLDIRAEEGAALTVSPAPRK